jgi:hypothetical protein
MGVYLFEMGLLMCIIDVQMRGYADVQMIINARISDSHREIAFKIKSIFSGGLGPKNDETRACGPCAMPFSNLGKGEG